MKVRAFAILVSFVVHRFFETDRLPGLDGCQSAAVSMTGRAVEYRAGKSVHLHTNWRGSSVKPSVAGPELLRKIRAAGDGRCRCKQVLSALVLHHYTVCQRLESENISAPDAKSRKPSNFRSRRFQWRQSQTGSPFASRRTKLSFPLTISRTRKTSVSPGFTFEPVMATSSPLAKLMPISSRKVFGHK